MKDLHPRHNYYLLGLVAIAATFNIMNASGSYLYAQTTDTEPPVVDTTLTSPLPQDPAPTLPAEGPTINPVLPCPSSSTSTSTNTSGTPCTPSPKPLFRFEPPVPRSKIKPKPTTSPANSPAIIGATRLLVRKLTIDGCTQEAPKLRKILSQMQTQTGTTSNTVNPTTDQTEITPSTNSTDTTTLPSDVNLLKQACELRLRLRIAQQQLNRLQNFVKNNDLSDIGLSSDDLNQVLSDWSSKVSDIKTDVDQGTADSLAAADQALKSWEGNEPQDLYRVLSGLKQLNALVKLIKDTTVNSTLTASMNTIVGDVKAGKFSDARKLLDTTYQQLVTVAQLQLRIQRGRPTNHQTLNNDLKKVQTEFHLKLKGLTTAPPSVPPTTPPSSDNTNPSSPDQTTPPDQQPSAQQ